jgi:hypothetical protein
MYSAAPFASAAASRARASALTSMAGLLSVTGSSLGGGCCDRSLGGAARFKTVRSTGRGATSARNPRSPGEWREMEEDEEFLRGGEPPPREAGGHCH